MSAEESAILLASGRAGRSDIVLRLEDRLFSVVEMKRPSLFRTCVDEDCPSLCEAYEDMSMGIRRDPRSHILVEPILQLHEYLVTMQLGYGIISSLDLSYFVRREGDNLFISEAITGRNRLLGAVAYFMHLAAGDKREFPFGKKGKEFPQECFSEQSTGNDESREFNDASFVASGDDSEPFHMVLRRLLPHICICQRIPLRQDGVEASFTVRTRVTVAVKLAPFDSGRAQALFTEMMVYYKLKKYWGKHVPMLVSHGTTAGRKVVYIATQLIYGHALGIERLTPEVVRATVNALSP